MNNGRGFGARLEKLERLLGTAERPRASSSEIRDALDRLDRGEQIPANHAGVRLAREIRLALVEIEVASGAGEVHDAETIARAAVKCPTDAEMAHAAAALSVGKEVTNGSENS